AGGYVKEVWEVGTEVGGACIASVEWAKWTGTEAEYKKWASDRGRITGETKQRAFGDQWKTAMSHMEVLVVDTDAATLAVANTKSLATGIDTALCAAWNAAKAAGKIGGGTATKLDLKGSIINTSVD